MLLILNIESFCKHSNLCSQKSKVASRRSQERFLLKFPRFARDKRRNDNRSQVKSGNREPLNQKRNIQSDCAIATSRLRVSNILRIPPHLNPLPRRGEEEGRNEINIEECPMSKFPDQKKEPSPCTPRLGKQGGGPETSPGSSTSPAATVGPNLIREPETVNR